MTRHFYLFVVTFNHVVETSSFRSLQRFWLIKGISIKLNPALW